MMMSSLANVKFIKTKVIFRYTKDVSNHVSSNLDDEIISCSWSNSSTKMGKNENGGKISALQKGAIRALQIRAGFRG